jgi:hypothetical protein
MARGEFIADAAVEAGTYRRLKVDFPDQLEMQVSTETIYQVVVYAVPRRPET